MGNPNAGNRNPLKNETPYDVIIVGAGPAGLAAAHAAQSAGLSYLVIEKNCIVHTIYEYPIGLTLYSTPELIELGGIPMVIRDVKPSREDAIGYYRRFVASQGLLVHTYERVMAVTGVDGDFTIRTQTQAGEDHVYGSHKVILATGAFDQANRLNVPGEDLPKVSHYFKEAHPFYDRDVLVVGGKSSAVETALTLYRAGAHVTLSYRRKTFTGIKYWVLPDLENRIKEGSIHAIMESNIKEIRPTEVVLQTHGQTEDLVIPNDFVFCMIGYEPDVHFFQKMGIKMQSEDKRPAFHPETFESNVPGVYVIGVITAGNIGSEVFIENSRAHGPIVISHITERLNVSP